VVLRYVAARVHTRAAHYAHAGSLRGLLRAFGYVATHERDVVRICTIPPRTFLLVQYLSGLLCLHVPRVWVYRLHLHTFARTHTHTLPRLYYSTFCLEFWDISRYQAWTFCVPPVWALPVGRARFIHVGENASAPEQAAANALLSATLLPVSGFLYEGFRWKAYAMRFLPPHCAGW